MQAFTTAQQYALPSAAARETASNRLTARLAAQKQAADRQAQNRAAGMGNAGGGGYVKDLRANNRAHMSGLGTGLADIEMGFLDKQQQGANILNQVGSGLQTGSLGVGRLGNEQQALQEAQRRNQMGELLQFFNSFIEGGNLNSTGTGRGGAFDVDFTNILNRIFQGLG